MTEPKTPTATVRPDEKLQADFFAAVRERGMTNAMLEGPARAYESSHPDMKCKWEYAPQSGDMTMVMAREAMGMVIVDHADLPTHTASATTRGPIKRGDLILMAGPIELMEMIAEEDARRAEEDIKMPEQAYRDNLEANKVRRQDGTIDMAKPTGRITRAVQSVLPKQSEGGE